MTGNKHGKLTDLQRGGERCRRDEEARLRDSTGGYVPGGEGEIGGSQRLSSKGTGVKIIYLYPLLIHRILPTTPALRDSWRLKTGRLHSRPRTQSVSL